MQTGTVKEFVYENDHTLSRLDWKENVVPVVQLGSSINIFHTIIDFSFFTAIPAKAGIMQDRDWLGNDKSQQTDFSEHDLILNKHYEFDIKAGYEFLFSNYKILPQLGFTYRNQKFEANDGYYQYASSGNYWSEDLTKTELNGTGLTYEQQFFLPYIYLDVEYSFLNNWNAKVYGKFYPYIFANAIDNHYLTRNQFNDIMNKGMGFSIGTEIQFKVFSLSFIYEYIKCDSGYTTYRTIGANSTLKSSSTIPGTDSSIFSFILTYKF